MTRFTSRLVFTALTSLIPLTSAVAQALTAIRAGRLVDVENGQVQRDQVLLVRGDRIDAVQDPARSLAMLGSSTCRATRCCQG